MATSNESESMALFCDFENVALGVRDAKYEKFDIKPVLERLLLKGSIVVKKAYCDWERYKGFKASMHEANFELIEIPHVRQSGKNSADIRLVVDALDLCYTKSHVDTFVIISGDSDFSPLVSKLRENAKRVIGVGVKQSTSDLLVANCDEFIFYDDLVRERLRAEAKRAKQETHAASKRTADEERRASDDDKRRKDDAEARKLEAVEIAVETFDALVSEQGDGGKIWASVLKSAIKRRKPDFNESYYGFRAFGNLLEEARARGLLDFGRDERSGTYVSRAQEAAAGADTPQRRTSSTSAEDATHAASTAAPAQPESRHEKRGNRPRDRNERDRRARRDKAEPRATDERDEHTGHGEHGSPVAAGEALSEVADGQWHAPSPGTVGDAGNGAGQDRATATNTRESVQDRQRNPRGEVAVADHLTAEAGHARGTTPDAPADAVSSEKLLSSEASGKAGKTGRQSKQAKTEPKTPASKTPARKTAAGKTTKKGPRSGSAVAADPAGSDATASSASAPAASSADADRAGEPTTASAKQPARKKAPARSRRPKNAASEA